MQKQEALSAPFLFAGKQKLAAAIRHYLAPREKQSCLGHRHEYQRGGRIFIHSARPAPSSAVIRFRLTKESNNCDRAVCQLAFNPTVINVRRERMGEGAHPPTWFSCFVCRRNLF